MFKKIIGHLKTVLIHKWYVFKYMNMCGYPFRGLLHDLSKFSWTEFSESVKYYTGDRSPINNCKLKNGYSLAWLHHKGRNNHHYEYWVDYLDKGGIPVKMPKKYVIELICDWIAGGKTYCKNRGEEFTYDYELKYVEQKLKTANIHKDTKKYIWYAFDRLNTFNDQFDEKYILKMISFYYNY